jgi:FkbM family methyltransferase
VSKLLPGTIAEGPTGLKWHYGGSDTDDHLPILGHELGIVNMALHAFPKGGVFVDVGAHIGLYTLELARKAEQVIAIEANEETCHKLEANILLNDLGDKVSTVHAAAWNKSALLRMEDPNSKVAGGSNQVRQPTEDEVWTVEGHKLDKLLKAFDLARVDMIKIDVEGAEWRVLKGARKTLMEFQPTVLVEVHDFLEGPENRQRVEHELEAVGYTHGDDIPYGEGYSWVCRPH